MLSRLSKLLVLAVLIALHGIATAPGSLAAPVVLAQQESPAEEEIQEEAPGEADEEPAEDRQGEEVDESPGGEDEDEPGAGEGEDAAAEEGPPWTYQMARLTLVLILLLALAIGGAYYRFVVKRSRGEV